MKTTITTFITKSQAKAQAMTDKLYAWGFWPEHFSRTFKKTGVTKFYIKARFTPSEAQAVKELFLSM